MPNKTNRLDKPIINAFRRGILFPPQKEAKDLTPHHPPVAFVPDRVIIPLKQGWGDACVPVVEVGDTVSAGQLIGRPQGMGVAVHAGIAGKVTAVAPHATPAGECLCITVEGDGTTADTSPMAKPSLPTVTNPEAEKRDYCRLMQEAGLVGMGGAGFPTFVKYETDKPIDLVLINGCECEPYLTCDEALMTHEAQRVIKGAQAFGQAAGGARTVICVEDNKPDAIAQLKAAATTTHVDILPLPTRYPQGGERQLIQTVTGQEVPAGGLPADCGIMVSNVATAAAMADALQGKPLTHRIVTVSGLVKRPANLLVPIGTLFSDLIRYCGGKLDTAASARIIAGGPMTGSIMDTTDLPVTKTTGGVLLLAPLSLTERNCIHCGACSRVCPSRLIPFAIDAAVVAGDMAACADYHAEQCIACGCCSYICPAKRFLATRVSLARGGVNRRLRQTKKS